MGYIVSASVTFPYFDLDTKLTWTCKQLKNYSVFFALGSIVVKDSITVMTVFTVVFFLSKE